MSRPASGPDVVLDDLRARIQSEVIGPSDPDYDRHRSVFNQMIDRRPAAIVRCRSRDDVIAALAFRAEHDLPAVVRAGGTSDDSVIDGGVVIDVSELNAARIDPGSRAAHIGAGLTWAELDEETQDHALAVTGARVSGLGVAGVALTGGSGWLERVFGPTCRSLIGAEVVMADGEVLRASAEQNPELLWALRGGGGSPGVVTELDLELQPVGPTIVSGFLGFRRERSEEVARFYRDYMTQAPPQVGGGLMLGSGRGGSLTIIFCFVGSIDDGERAVAPLRELGPSLDAVAPNEYRALQSMSDLRNPWGMRVNQRRGFLGEFSDEALIALLEAVDEPASGLSQLLLQPLGHPRPTDDGVGMAFDFAGASWGFQCTSLWPPVPSLDRGNIAWVDRATLALEPFAVESANGGESRARLLRVQNRFDPENVFRGHHESRTSVSRN